MDSSKTQIPINIRTVGNPTTKSQNNIYTLYIEDYVHTFMQKNLENGKNVIKIALFGKYIDDNFIISGAAVSTGNTSKDKASYAPYFASCEYLGTATITKNDKNNIRFEIAAGGIIILIEDYYIYYDQNEEMQNYLISWNTPSMINANSRQQRSVDAARYGKILQAYNKEEAKVGLIWNVMNLFGLGFAVCFMVYAIITINSYSKMQSIQSGIDYCIKMLDMQLAENEINIENNVEQTSQINDNIDKDETEVSKIEEYKIENADENGNENNIENDIENMAKTTEQEALATTNSDIPQYYIVQKGDTLRNICYEIYGDYDYVEKVCLWNDIPDPNNILCGQKLLLR
jgi:hypothetical protein